MSAQSATIVFTRDRGWVAIDTGERNPQIIKHWVSKYEAQSLDKKIRFYLTDASKFGVEIGQYSRLHMGLDKSHVDDWYQGYFKDLNKQISTRSLQDFGLARVLPENPSDRDSFVVEERGPGAFFKLLF